MTPEFFSYSDILDPTGPVMILLIVICSIIALVALAFGVVSYIFESLGLYTIAKRRGIHHPGLAWVPIANVWIIGSISDQYQYVAKGKIRNRRKVLLGLMIATSLISVVSIVLVNLGIFDGMIMTGDVSYPAFTFAVILEVIIAMALWVISILTAVFTYITYYDLYRSCTTSNSVLFLVLSIFFDFLIPFFIFACRKKDEGMPPRRVVVPVAPWNRDGQEPAPVQPIVYPEVEPAVPETVVEVPDMPMPETATEVPDMPIPEMAEELEELPEAPATEE